MIRINSHKMITFKKWFHLKEMNEEENQFSNDSMIETFSSFSDFFFSFSPNSWNFDLPHVFPPQKKKSQSFLN